MIVPDKDKGIIRFIFSEANFCLGSNPFPEKKDEKIFFSSGMMMVRSIVRGDCPCIFQPLSSETVVSSVSPLLLRYTPQCYGHGKGEVDVRFATVAVFSTPLSLRATFSPMVALHSAMLRGTAREEFKSNPLFI